MAAARAWAAGNLFAETSPGQEPEALADARLWNASPDELAGLVQHMGLASEAPAVWRQHLTTVAAFCVAGTQWRTGLDVASGRLRMIWIGLDYAGARISILESGLAITPELWAGIRIMEDAAKATLNGETLH